MGVLSYFAAACEAQGFKMFPPWYKYLESESVGGRCTPIIDFNDRPEDVGKILLALAELLLRLGGLVAVAFVIYGGVRYVLSQGEPDNAAKALKTIINALVGLAIAASATAAVNLIGGRLI